MAAPNLKFLEDAGRYKKVDPENFYQLIVDFPSQLRQAVEIARKFQWSKSSFRPLQVVVAGLGGSAIGGDLVRSFLAYELDIPFYVVRHYRLPAFVGLQTLLFASSYSGNTEETLAAFEEAVSRKAEIISITTGGKLAASAANLITIPSGYPPRAALGFSFVPLLLSLGKMGLIKNYSNEILLVADFLENEKESWEKEVHAQKNEAKKTAGALFWKIPLVYAGADYFDAAAVRLKGQICENAKQLAFFNFFPEFNHNELVGFGVLEHVKDKLTAVFLQDKDDHPRVALRMKIVTEILKRKKVPVIRLVSKGESVLERMFYLILLGDFVSYYLAILNGVNPKPVEVIDYLKGQLEKA